MVPVFTGMMAPVLYIPAFIILIVGGCGKESGPTAPQNQNPFIGTWRLVKPDGKSLDPAQSWVFSESSVTFHAGKATVSGSYSCDANKAPKTIELTTQGAAFSGFYDSPSSSSLIIKLIPSRAPVRARNFNVASRLHTRRIQ